jgi:hypothetical protein
MYKQSIKYNEIILGALQPSMGDGLLNHTQRSSTVVRTPLDE